MTRRLQGFTLVELVVVMIVIGILAVFAFSRINTRAFDPPAFYQEAIATVRFAQKEAIAKRRTVCVDIATIATSGGPASTVTVKLAPTAGTSTCSADLTSPRGTTPFVVTSAANVTITPGTASFTFDPMGRPSNTAAATFAISGGGGLSFTVEPETGYVHP